MRDPKRIDPLLSKIRSIWLLNPDLRLMQLFCNVYGHSDTYYVEDNDLYKALDEVYSLSEPLAVSIE